jgi:putative signal transducing protein
MVEIVRTNDIVLMGYLQSLLENAKIPVLIADMHISALEGMIGAFPRRLMVPEDHEQQARRILREAGFEAELRFG